MGSGGADSSPGCAAIKHRDMSPHPVGKHQESLSAISLRPFSVACIGASSLRSRRWQRRCIFGSVSEYAAAMRRRFPVLRRLIAP